MTNFYIGIVGWLLLGPLAVLHGEPTTVTKATQNFQERGGRVVRAETLPAKPVILVDLHRVAVTDADLSALAEMTELEVLDLSYTKISDQTLERIAKLPKLKHLSVYGTQISDAGLKHVANIRTLDTLFLAETSITDVGLEHISRLSNLQALELDHTKITSIRSLDKLTKLRRLELHHNPLLTDIRIEFFRNMKNLTWVDLHKSNVTKQVINDLQKHIPNARFAE